MYAGRLHGEIRGGERGKRQCSCVAQVGDVAAYAMRAMAVEFPEVEGHPNRLPFEGCLTLVDVASDKAPSGARGHRVVLTRGSGGGGAAQSAGHGGGLQGRMGWA